jgi:hypothetical protein
MPGILVRSTPQAWCSCVRKCALELVGKGALFSKVVAMHVITGDFLKLRTTDFLTLDPDQKGHEGLQG